MATTTENLLAHKLPSDKSTIPAAMANAYGLVVGIANYKYLNKLPKIVLKDAADIHGVLVDPSCCAYPSENVELLVDATQEGLRKALERLARRCNRESTAFFYISSHGCSIDPGPGGGEYILTVDTCDYPDEALVRTAISGTEFTKLLQSIPARKLVVVLDCCHAGGIGLPKGRTRQPEKPIPDSYYQSLAQGRGRVILASSRSNEVAYVFDGASNSLFTQHLLSGLKAGVPGPGNVIRIFDLFNHIQPRVTRDCAQQHPVFKAEVEENFPIALYLGGKSAAAVAAVDKVSSLDNAPLEGPGWVIHQLQLLLGTTDRLKERDHRVLSSALYSVLSAGKGRKPSLGTTEIDGEVKEVIARVQQGSNPVVSLSPYPNTDLVSAFVRIGLRLNLCWKGLAKSLPNNNGSWTVDQWLSFLTPDVICERSVLRFHLIAPDENWIKPLMAATALAMENLWQQVRSVLTQNGFSFAVARSRLEVDSNLRSIPPGVLKQISDVAKEAEKTWPEFPHFAERHDLPVLEALLPLPESSLRSPVAFKVPNGFAARLIVDGTLVAERGEKQATEINYWPALEGPVECVLECNRGGIFVPMIRSRLRRLYPMEEAVFHAAAEQTDISYSLGLKNDVLQSLWPRILAGKADSHELGQVLHILRDARDAYQMLSRRRPSLRERLDTYWDAMELIRKHMNKGGQYL